MNKENCTKGPVYDYKGEVREDDPVSGRTIATVSDRLRDDEIEPNAELIAEAFNVLHKTGMTPRELAKQVRHLSDTMHSVADSLTKQGFGYGRTKSKRGLEVQEAMLIEVRLLNTVLAKYQPTNA